jgi:Flp pilus assembly protein TadD
MATTRITHEMVDKLQESLMLGRATPAQLRERAETEHAWAVETESYELEPGLSRSYLLSAAADDYLSAGDAERALAVAGEARDTAAAGDWEGHLSLIRAQLGLGSVEAAVAVAKELRQRAAEDPMLAEMVGDAFELADELAQAERWYTIGLRGLDRTAGRFWAERLLRDRHRVRRDQGKPLDGFDEEFEALAR